AYMAALFAAYHVQHLKPEASGLFSKFLHSDLLLSPRGGLFLERDRSSHRIGQDRLRQAEESQHVVALARLAEAVAHAVPEHRDGIFLAHDLCDSAAKAAEDVVLLGGDDGPGLARGLEDELPVYGLYRVHVYDTHVQAPGFQQRCGLERRGDHVARGNNGGVPARAHDDALAYLKLVALEFRHGLHRAAAHA